MSNPWFRMYTDFLRDPKMLSLAFEDQRHFIAVLALKSEGTLDNGASGPLLDRMVAQFIWVDHSAIGEVKRRLIEAGLIDDEWQPIAWDRRQFKSDSSAERTRKYRDKQKKKDCDDDVTSRDRHKERHSDALDTDTDTDTDTEQKQQAPPELDWEAWERWVEYRRKIRKPLKQASIPAAQKKLAAMGPNQAQAVENSIANGWQGLFKPTGEVAGERGFVV